MGPHAGGHMFSSIAGGMGPCHICLQTPVYKFSIASGMGPFAVVIYVTKHLINMFSIPGGMGPYAVVIHVTKHLFSMFSSISAGMGPQTDGYICFLAPDQ